MTKEVTAKKTKISFYFLMLWLFTMIIFVIFCALDAIKFYKHEEINLLHSRLMTQLLRVKMTGALGIFLSILYCASIFYLYYIMATTFFIFVYDILLCTFEVMVVNEKITQFIKTFQSFRNNLECPYNEEIQKEMFRTFRIIAENIWNYNR